MLTNEEIAQYERLVADARKDTEVIRISNELQSGYREKQIDLLVDKEKVGRDEAERRIPKRSMSDLSNTKQTLALDETIEIAGQVMLVSELVARGKEFDGTAMPDPIEGSDYGLTTAKYYHNNGINPCICSFAHGVMTVYKIAVQRQGMDAFERTTTEVVSAGPDNLIESLDPEGFPHKWQKKNGTYRPKCTIENVAYLVTGYGITVQYDVIGKDLLIKIPGAGSITENAANTAIETINSLAALNDIPIGQVKRYVEVIADRNAINPVANWITSRSWDGKDRFPALFATLVAREGFPEDFKEILIRKWLLSAVAAGTLPSGFHSRGILTFQGEQGLGKTSWFRQLVPDGVLRAQLILTGHHLDPSNKDSLSTAIKHWVVEIGELDSSFRKDVARLKGFITLDKDSVRKVYARANSDYARRTVFCASVNEENFLIDQTGNSRFWTIPLVQIDYDHDIDMQQVFAQLHEELQRGATWWLTPDEDKRLDELNEAHRYISITEERVLSVLNPALSEDKWKNKTAFEILTAAGYRNPSNHNAQECCTFLRKKGYQEKKIQGKKKWFVPIASDFTRL